MIEKIRLFLQTGEEVCCLKEGNGSYPIFIIGPGSIYLPMFSDQLKHQVTFYAFDDFWTCRKGEHTDPRIVNSMSMLVILDRNRQVIAQLKQQLGYTNVAIMGISAASLMAFEYALHYGDDINCVFGVGVPLIKLDALFTATDTSFRELHPNRWTTYQTDQARFMELNKGENFAERLPDSNMESGRLTPNSEFVEGARSASAKMFFDRQDYETLVLRCWRYSVDDQKVNNEAMRLHFFSNILPALDAVKLANEINKRRIPLALFFGHDDFITPRDVKVLSNLSNCNIFEYRNCGHYIMLEARQRFDTDLVRMLENINTQTQRMSYGL